MFAYCNNNPVTRIDPFGCRPVITVNIEDGGGNYTPINGQDREPYSSYPYGNSTLGYSGCEALACYILLVRLGIPQSLESVISFFENRFSTITFSGWGMGGYWGAMPSDIAAFLDAQNLQYIKLTNNDFIALDCYGPASGYYILSYWNGWPYFSSYHTILLECDGCEYTAYNWKTKTDKPFDKDHFLGVFT